MSIVMSELSLKPYEAFIKQDDGFPVLFLNNLLNSVLQIIVKKNKTKPGNSEWDNIPQNIDEKRNMESHVGSTEGI